MTFGAKSSLLGNIMTGRPMIKNTPEGLICVYEMAVGLPEDQWTCCKWIPRFLNGKIKKQFYQELF
jgi:hypothetical protein